MIKKLISLQVIFCVLIIQAQITVPKGGYLFPNAIQKNTVEKIPLMRYDSNKLNYWISPDDFKLSLGLDKEWLLLSGGQITGDLFINTTGNVFSNSFNSNFALISNYSGTGVYIPNFIDVKRSNGNSNDVFYGLMSRAEYTGSNPIKEVFGNYNIGRITGSGNINAVGGQINIGSNKGTGDVETIFGTESWAKAEGTGNNSVTTILNRFVAYVNQTGVNISNAYANSSTFEFRKGNIDVGFVHELDFKGPTTNNDPEATINKFAYLGTLDTGINVTPTTFGYFIYSASNLPSYLKGVIHTDVDNNVIESSSNTVLVPKGYLNDKYMRSNGGNMSGSLSVDGGISATFNVQASNFYASSTFPSYNFNFSGKTTTIIPDNTQSLNHITLKLPKEGGNLINDRFFFDQFGMAGDKSDTVEMHTGNEIGFYSSSSINLESAEVNLESPITSLGGLLNAGAINFNKLKLYSLQTAPSSSTDTGSVGEIRFCSDGIYVCIATNTWKRILYDSTF